VSALFLLPGAIKWDPAVDAWLSEPDPLRLMARMWFGRMRSCGADVRELMHDGCPTACVKDAAFAYVNAFRAHVNVGFFYGATLPDPARRLEGTGKRMRHVKLRPGHNVDEESLARLITAAYDDIQSRLASR
jgi:hypothetical protein